MLFSLTGSLGSPVFWANFHALGPRSFWGFLGTGVGENVQEDRDFRPSHYISETIEDRQYSYNGRSRIMGFRLLYHFDDLEWPWANVTRHLSACSSICSSLCIQVNDDRYTISAAKWQPWSEHVADVGLRIVNFKVTIFFNVKWYELKTVLFRSSFDND